MDLAGRSATLLVAVPIIAGHLEGLYLGERAVADRKGLGDLRIRVGVNLYGAPARRLPEFAKTPPSKINVGASVAIVAPTGQYDTQRIVNLGTNRWAFKPEAAIIRNAGAWMFEIYGGVWLFTDNTELRQRAGPIAEAARVSAVQPATDVPAGPVGFGQHQLLHGWTDECGRSLQAGFSGELSRGRDAVRAALAPELRARCSEQGGVHDDRRGLPRSLGVLSAGLLATRDWGTFLRSTHVDIRDEEIHHDRPGQIRSR